jgi:hypothetical protein
MTNLEKEERVIIQLWISLKYFIQGDPRLAGVNLRILTTMNHWKHTIIIIIIIIYCSFQKSIS